MTTRRPTRRSGFTLLELCLVLAILVMVAAVSYPSLSGLYADARVKAGADHLRMRFAEARAFAIEDGRPYRFAVAAGTSNYKLAPDSPDHWGESGGGGDADSEGSPGHVIEDALPSQIKFNLERTGQAAANGMTTILVFLPDGTCTDDATLQLTLEDALPVEVRMRALTGSVTVRTIYNGGNR